MAGKCWLCQDLGAIATHGYASDPGGLALWMAHEPWSRTHLVRPCPACTLCMVLAQLDDARSVLQTTNETLARVLGDRL